MSDLLSKYNTRDRQAMRGVGQSMDIEQMLASQKQPETTTASPDDLINRFKSEANRQPQQSQQNDGFRNYIRQRDARGIARDVQPRESRRATLQDMLPNENVDEFISNDSPSSINKFTFLDYAKGHQGTTEREPTDADVRIQKALERSTQALDKVNAMLDKSNKPSRLKGFFKNVTGGVKDRLSSVKATATLGRMKFGDALRNIKGRIQDKYQDVKDNVQEKVENVKEGVHNKYENVRDGVRNVKDNVQERVDNVKDGVHTKVQNVKESAQTIWEESSDMADDIIDRFSNAKKALTGPTMHRFVIADVQESQREGHSSVAFVSANDLREKPSVKDGALVNHAVGNYVTLDNKTIERLRDLSNTEGDGFVFEAGMNKHPNNTGVGDEFMHMPDFTTAQPSDVPFDMQKHVENTPKGTRLINRINGTDVRLGRHYEQQKQSASVVSREAEYDGLEL